MSIYGRAALLAVHALAEGAGPVQQVWSESVAKVTKSPHSVKKGCPRGAFLGLCSEGYVNGVPAGGYTRSRKSAGYAIRAVKALRARSELAEDADALWREATAGMSRRSEGELDVVLALWKGRHVRRAP